MKFIKKNSKYFIIAGIGLGLALIGLLSWNVFFVKYKIFSDMEKEFEEAAERYYEFRSQYLPKKGEYKEITLQELYDAKQIDDLYVPNTKKMCDVNKSYVRIYLNDKDEYVYDGYLKCGRFSSKGDHEGPKITLNGDSTIYIGQNQAYEELGVKEIKDNKDGNIDPTKVTIDSSNYEPSKLGTYTIKYTAMDSSYNKTTVTRKIVVAKNLTYEIISNTHSNGYYRGEANNYILFSGQLFRIVNVNEDGTIKIITDEPVVNLDANYTEYENSNIDKWLKEYYYPKLHNIDDYIEETSYCVGEVGAECDKTITSKIGLLTYDEYNKTLEGTKSSIESNYFMIGNKMNGNTVVVPQNDYINTNEVLPAIRPVLTLKRDLFIKSGNGTKENPYHLNDYAYAKANAKLNTRIAGEYVTYSGLNFRIISVDNNSNVKMIMDKPWVVQPNSDVLKLNLTNISEWAFSLKDENNPGYILNNDYLDYIDTKSLVNTEYEVPTIEKTQNYQEYKKTKINAKIVLPTTYELFTARGNDYDEYIFNYIYIDKNAESNSLVYINRGAYNSIYSIDKDSMEFNIKPIITLNGNLKIISGKGTENNPYILR